MALVRSAAEIQHEVRMHINRKDLDSALYLIHRVVNQIFLEPINTTRIFSSKLLDDLCQEIGATNWRHISKRTSSPRDFGKYADKSSNVIVYVVSQLHASGGHTAALADIIRLGPAAQNVILVTGIVGPTDHAAIQHRFDAIANVSFEYAPRGRHYQKLEWLQQRLLALSPEAVWLFNHHQDSVAIAAVQPDAGYQLRYYHHGDHHLCLGVHLEYADHFDMHPMGFHNCREKLGIRENRYLPLIVSDLGDRPDGWGFLTGSGLITCTAASSIKIESPYFIRYVDVIPELLRASGGKHIHIGHMSPMALMRLNWGMRKLGLPESSLVHIPFVPSVWKALHEHQVDLYIASFPYAGARTMIEAMGAGVPIAFHVHTSSRLLCTFDMAYEEAPMWRTPQQLYDYVNQVDANELIRQGRLARKKYEEFHSENLLKHALDPKHPSFPAPPLRDGFLHDDFQEALDISNQVSCSGVLWRILKRTSWQLKSRKI